MSDSNEIQDTMGDIKTLDDVENYYLEFDQRGEHPREYDPSDYKMRQRAKEFLDCKKEIDKRTAARQKAMEKYKND